MKKYHLLSLIIAVLLPLMAFSQEEAQISFEDFITELNSECPIVYNTEWAVISFDVSGDTAFAKVEVPSSLTYFLSSLTGNSDNVKQLWKKQLDQFGQTWRTFIRRIKRDKRLLVVELIPQYSETTARITFTTEDLKKK